jgi:hypothetical protein
LRLGHFAGRQAGEHRGDNGHHDGCRAEDFPPQGLREVLLQFVRDLDFSSHGFGILQVQLTLEK